MTDYQMDLLKHFSIRGSISQVQDAYPNMLQRDLGNAVSDLLIENRNLMSIHKKHVVKTKKKVTPKKKSLLKKK